MSEVDIYRLLDKYGKLAGAVNAPLFSDRQFADEIIRLLRVIRD